MLSQGQALGQTPDFPIKGKKLFPLKPFLHLKGRALKGMETTGKVGCPLQQPLPHFTHFLCATFQVCHPSSQMPKEGDDNPALPSWGSCVSSLWQPRQSQRPNHRRKRVDFNGITIPGESGANPREIPSPSHLSPLPGGNKSSKGTRRKTSPPYWIFFPLLFPKQCLAFVTRNPPLSRHLPASGDAGTGRNPPAKLPGAAAVPCFYRRGCLRRGLHPPQ